VPASNMLAAEGDGFRIAWARSLRIVDGPDAVHRRSIARQELRRERPFVG